MVFFVVFHYVTGAALSNEDLTKAFKQLGVKFEADQTKIEEKIDHAVDILIGQSLTDDCPGQGLYEFNEGNKHDTKTIVIPRYVSNMECWWYISTTLNTGKLELSFSNFESESSHDYLKVLKGSSTSSPQLHKLTGDLGAKKITWTDSFVSIYWRTDHSNSNYSPMTGYLRYKP